MKKKVSWKLLSSRKKIILTIILLSYFVTSLDGSIVLTGLAEITKDLHLNQMTLSWVQNSYILAFGGFILLGGRLGDVYGRRRIMSIALILFGFGSTIAGAAPNGGIMIFARFLQGVGAAILAPTSLALLMDTFEGKERVTAVAWYSSIAGLGSSIGLVFGGFLASFTSWRVGFYINIPLTIIMLIMIYKVLDKKEVVREKFDILGTMLSIFGIFAFVYSINGAENFVFWFILSIILLTTFVIVERRSAVPIMPFELFEDRTRTGAYIARMLYMCAMFGFWFYISECLQIVFGFSPVVTGVAYFPMTISLFIAAICVPNLINRYGNRNILFLGSGFLVVGFIGTLCITEQSSYLDGIALPLTLLGFGQGFAMSPLTNLGIHNTEVSIAGSASGLVNVAHQVGGSIGLSTMITYNGAISSMMTSFHRAMMIGLIFIVVMIFVEIVFFKKDRDVPIV